MIERLKALSAQARERAVRLTSFRLVRAAIRYNDLRGNRLAGAVSFYGFFSLFPLLALGGSIALTVIGPEAIQTLQEIVNENLPGLRLDVSVFAQNAGTVGLIGAVTLLWTGLWWVDACRAAVRSMWELNDAPGNYAVRKLWDLAVLVGLGVVMAVSWGATAMVNTLTEQVLNLLGFTGDVGEFTTRAAALALAITSSSVLFGYLLAGLPRIPIPARVLIPAALVGGLTFEVMKQVIAQFAILAAPDNTYAAFALPLALLAWIYLVTRLLMLLAAVTAEWGKVEVDDPPAAKVADQAA